MSKNFQELAKKALEEANERKSEDKSKLIEQLKKINDQNYNGISDVIIDNFTKNLEI